MSAALAQSPMVGRIVAHLVDLPGDVGCRHLARDRDELDASLLVDLGLVKPIMSRVPQCRDHGCPRSGACPWESDFFPEASGAKAGVKYRRTVDGDVLVSGSVTPLEERLASLPLATAVLAQLADGPRSLFAIQWRLIEGARADVRDGKNTERVAPHRPALLGVIRLLTDLGIVHLSDDGTVSLI
ncbi:MAG: hypothetical protein M3N47_03690 [Chloroflexota bacterium]|nr:hypothetical protein [Chloroflexota bacterium]